jgi:hypothetical protein
MQTGDINRAELVVDWIRPVFRSMRGLKIISTKADFANPAYKAVFYTAAPTRDFANSYSRRRRIFVYYFKMSDATFTTKRAIAVFIQHSNQEVLNV